ncbi:MAG: prephenate dehydrogenase/arogenate dehydrogenase family protein [Acidobacteria bacterium]|nr:prephenate dehydrogenase/arogenate dehydrogenase family protein [Acidobacteriota bacterium]
MFQRIAVLGCGLIGGSFALGLKQRGFAGQVIGWDREEVLARAKERGAIDAATTDIAEAVGEADLVYLATPVTLILELLPTVARAAKAGALVTDSGSTKVRICRLAREAMPEAVRFLGGHPMAGKEASGIENANGDLFVGTKYIVIREAQEAEEAEPFVALGATQGKEEFLVWVRRLGAEPVELDAETHDWAVALVSHLPQLVSTALASAVWDETDEDGLPLQLAGSGLRDMMRLAGSPYELWRDICLTNADNLARALERLEQRLERLRTHLRSKELEEEFQKAQQTCAWLRGAAEEKKR